MEQEGSIQSIEKQEKDGLREKILGEMLTNYKDALERNFELAKQLIRITPEGKVNVIVRGKITGKERITLYHIGKVYALRAGVSNTDEVTNKELMEELGLPEGSVRAWTTMLREEGKIKSTGRGTHQIAANVIEKTLSEIIGKLKGVENGN